MCYSAQVTASFRTYVRRLGARADLAAFHTLFERRSADPRIKVPKALEADFLEPHNDEEAAIAQVITSFHKDQAQRWEQELFKQRKRLADAQRQLQSRITKAATESQRIASAKVDALLARLGDLKRPQLLPRDSRIYPGYYAPVMVREQGQRVVKPMRYQCRPAGKPAMYDMKYPGTYNARRDNLQGFWKAQFGHTHGVVIVRPGLLRARGPAPGRGPGPQARRSPGERCPGVPPPHPPGHAGGLPLVALAGGGRTGSAVLCRHHRRAPTRGGRRRT